MPTRLCYLGKVLHTRPIAQGGTRAPFQTGAELYGYAGRESEAEVLSLMLRVLGLCGLRNIHVDLGHVGIYRGLVTGLDITTEQEAVLFDALQRKAAAELKQVLGESSIATEAADMLLGLIELNGGIAVLDDARRMLSRAGGDILGCIDELERVAELTERQVKGAPLYFDLAELRGYHYYTGIAFAAYVPGQGQGIAFGGRYDDIGRAFGRARPATGFSTDVEALFRLAAHQIETTKGIYAPSSDVPGLYEMI